MLQMSDQKLQRWVYALAYTNNIERSKIRLPCFGFFQKFLAMTNSSSVSTSFSPCIVFRSSLSFGYHTKIAVTCFLNFFGMAKYYCVKNHKQF